MEYSFHMIRNYILMKHHCSCDIQEETYCSLGNCWTDKLITYYCLDLYARTAASSLKMQAAVDIQSRQHWSRFQQLKPISRSCCLRLRSRRNGVGTCLPSILIHALSGSRPMYICQEEPQGYENQFIYLNDNKILIRVGKRMHNLEKHFQGNIEHGFYFACV